MKAMIGVGHPRTTSGMNAEPFTLDTNILLYAIDMQGIAKHEVALHAFTQLHEGGGIVVLQTRGALCNVTGMKRPHLRAAAEQLTSRVLDALSIVSAAPQDLTDALGAQRLHNLPFWDAMLWATARRSGCKVLLTEDFQDGRTLGGVTLRNPFRMSAAELASL